MEKNDNRNLTDQDFYQQACEYFYYHAEQRTTMINYFIAVFGAGMALYGSMLEKQFAIASMCVAFFLLVVSFVFYAIDMRNIFDVKHSQSVICQIERDYNKHVLTDETQKYVYGVFSNEDNTFEYYGIKDRNKDSKKEYMTLRKKYKRLGFFKLFKFCSNYEVNKELLKKDMSAFAEHEAEKSGKLISAYEIEQSFKSPTIINLSISIKTLYYACMILSILGTLVALIMAVS